LHRGDAEKTRETNISIVVIICDNSPTPQSSQRLSGEMDFLSTEYAPPVPSLSNSSVFSASPRLSGEMDFLSTEYAAPVPSLMEPCRPLLRARWKVGSVKNWVWETSSWRRSYAWSARNGWESPPNWDARRWPSGWARWSFSI